MTGERDQDLRLRGALRDALDRELGPHPRWTDAPAAGRAATAVRGRRGRWPLRLIAVAAVVGSLAGGALLAGRLTDDRSPDVNGWIAFTAADPGPADRDDVDIWLATPDEPPHRAVGAGDDDIDQLCPAFSLDGRRLAYGVAQHPDPSFATRASSYRNAALVIADVDTRGVVTERWTLPLEDGDPPPCPAWSPDGEHIAFAVPLTSPVNPDMSAAGSEVRVVTAGSRAVTVLPNLLATDMAWSPTGDRLAIASAQEQLPAGGIARNGRIHIWSPDAKTLERLDDTIGANELTWAPDGQRIAYTSREGLLVRDLASGETIVASGPYEASHGVGPVWSPVEDRIVFQRRCASHPDTTLTCREQHEIVVVSPGDPRQGGGEPTEEVIKARVALEGGTSRPLFPTRVTWSPDGASLLVHAWTEAGGMPDNDVLAVIDVNGGAPAIIAGPSDTLLADPGYPHVGPGDPAQAWGPRPSP